MNASLKLADVIGSLSASDLIVVVNFPDKFDPSTGGKAFSCEFSEKECAGTYRMEITERRRTNSLDVLGNEISHWVNHTLFGETHDDPENLSAMSMSSSIYHLYFETRNLISCRR